MTWKLVQSLIGGETSVQERGIADVLITSSQSEESRRKRMTISPFVNKKSLDWAAIKVERDIVEGNEKEKEKEKEKEQEDEVNIELHEPEEDEEDEEIVDGEMDVEPDADDDEVVEEDFLSDGE